MGEPREPLAGMTLNERLYARGLFDRFDRARAAQDRVALRIILAEVEVSDIDRTIELLFAAPS
ncbi:MAG: hypothetical protein C0520_01830 [Sphingopyxis sp.]|nr:hypothetical protein [Sphingopyxis sp.]